MRCLFVFLFFVNLIPQWSFSAAVAFSDTEDYLTIFKHLSTVTSTQEVLQSAMESYANGDQLPFHNLLGQAQIQPQEKLLPFLQAGKRPALEAGRIDGLRQKEIFI